MAFPIAIRVYDRGTNGVPTTTNGRALPAESCEFSSSSRAGFEAMRVPFTATVDEALDWARHDYLMRQGVAYGPEGQTVWEGVLTSIEVALGPLTISLAIKDMANRLQVHYSAPNGDRGTGTTYTNTVSQALYGTKERTLNLSTTTSTAANTRAQTGLNMIAFPAPTLESGGGKAGDRDPITEATVTLGFSGRYVLLDWLLTSNSDKTTLTDTGTQVGSLITSYNSTNNFLVVGDILTTGVNETVYIEPNTTYREAIEKRLAIGNSAHQRISYGVWEDGVFRAQVWAGSTPDTITYFESARTNEIRDAYNAIVQPWDVRPDAMVQVQDVLGVAPPTGAIAGVTRKYAARVRCTVDRDGASVVLESDNVDALDAQMASPIGAGAQGLSDRQSAIERALLQPIRAHTIPTDDGSYAGGLLQPNHGGTGIANTGTINTSGGNVTNTGGGNVDLGTGAGIGGAGSSGVTTGGGLADKLAIWSSSSALTYDTNLHWDTTNNRLGVNATSPGFALDVTGDIHATGTMTIDSYSSIGGAGLDSNIGLKVKGRGTSAATRSLRTTDSASATTFEVKDDGALSASGTSLTLAGNAFTLTGAAFPVNPSGAASGNALTYNGTTWAATTLTASTISDFSEAVDDRVAALLVAGTNITLTYNDVANTLTIAAATSSVSGSGSADKLAIWSSTSALTFDTNLHWDTTNNRLGINDAAPGYSLDVTGDVHATGTMTIGSYSSIGGLGLDSNIGLKVKGRGTTSATRSLRTTDSAGVTTFDVKDDGTLSASGATIALAGNGFTLTGGSFPVSMTGTASGKALVYDGTNWAPTTLTGTVDGSGASPRLAYWSDANTLTSDTDLSWDSTNNRLETVQLHASGSGAFGGSILSTARLYAKGSDTSSSNYAIFAEASDGADLFWVRNDGVVAAPVIRTNLGVTWDLGGFTSDTATRARLGFLTVKVAGVDRYIEVTDLGS